MLTTQQLREQRASLFEKMKAVSDRASAENRLLSAEEVATYDRIDAEYTQVEDEIDRREAAQAREKNMVRRDPSGTLEDGGGQVVDDGEAYNRVFTNFLRRGMADLSPEDKAVMSGKASQILNAAGIGTGAAGGFTVSPEFRDKLIETQKWYGPMLQEAEVIHTETGAQLPWPTNDDTANVGAILAENTQVTEQDATFGTANIDSAFNLGVWLPRKLGTRLGRILNQHFTTGTGTNQPDGIVTSAAVGATSTGSFAATGGVSFDNLIDLIEALDPAYGGGEGLKFMGHQSVRKAIRKLKDSQGRYLWEPSVKEGVPNQVQGYPFILNNDMPTLAASSKSLLFGNIRDAYLIRIVRDMQTMRLQERYADFLQVGFLAFERADGTLQDANAVRVLQTTATA